MSIGPRRHPLVSRTARERGHTKLLALSHIFVCFRINSKRWVRRSCCRTCRSERHFRGFNRPSEIATVASFLASCSPVVTFSRCIFRQLTRSIAIPQIFHVGQILDHFFLGGYSLRYLSSHLGSVSVCFHLGSSSVSPHTYFVLESFGDLSH